MEESYFSFVKLIPDGTEANPNGLNYDDIGELLFDVLKINPEDCISFNFNTGREVKCKTNIDTLSYMTLEHITFKEHLVTVHKQRQNIVRVTFKNVPLNVPDVEILYNLFAAFGKAVDSMRD